MAKIARQENDLETAVLPVHLRQSRGGPIIRAVIHKYHLPVHIQLLKGSQQPGLQQRQYLGFVEG
jgi:hypothetical protein